MRVKLAFGKSGLHIDLPPGPTWRLLQVPEETALQDPASALSAALDDPIGTPPLVDLARGKATAAIAVCDITRPAPNFLTLPPLLERLHRAGIPRHAIAIHIATGLHRAATPSEIETILGPSIAGSYRVLNHDAKDCASHTALGHTRSGTPVHIDSSFLSSDLHVTLGFIEQHLMAGFSGGRKLIVPGLASQETIKELHSPRFMRSPTATEGSIEENLLHAEFLEIAAMARHDFMLDVALSRQREITGIFAGHAIKAHEAGVSFVRDSLLTSLSEPVDAAITTGAGYPLDLTFYQTIKGITSAQHIVKPGGKILVFGECAEGIGTPSFRSELARLSSYAGYLKEIETCPVAIDQWQLEKLAMAGLQHETMFYVPGISPRDTGGLAHQVFPTPQSAVQSLLNGLPCNATIAVIPEGPYVFAQVARTAALIDA